MMKRTTRQVGTFAVNCTILSENGQAWIVDPGSDAQGICAYLAENDLVPVGILLTHAHFDHIGGIPGLQAAYPDLPVCVHPDDIACFTHPLNCLPPDYPGIALPRNLQSTNQPTNQLTNQPTNQLTILPTPGHTPGGVCYYLPGERLLLSGDTLFAGSIGRTDLPGGDMATLMASLEKLKTLPPETIVIPGHGPFTTIGDELASNPFFHG